MVTKMGRRPISDQEKRNRIAFGKRLRELRVDRSLSLNKAAKESGFDHTRLSRIESGTRPVSLSDLDALARVYGVPWESLVMVSPRQQLPMAIAAGLGEEPRQPVRRDQQFRKRVSGEEKKELQRYLGYLRFRARFPEFETLRMSGRPP